MTARMVREQLRGEGARPYPQENTYDLVGNLTQKRLPSGEEYRFVYSSKGSLEKSTFPDGTYELTGTDRNGRVTRRVDRRLLEVSARYNKADLLVENIASDATYGLISQVSTHTHLGPASVTESEAGVQKVASSREYHLSLSRQGSVTAVPDHRLSAPRAAP